MDIAFLLMCAMFPLATEGGSAGSRFESLTTPVMKRLSNNTARQMRDTGGTSPPLYLQLPVFLHSRLPLVGKEHFSPTSGTGLERLPEPVREVLLPAPRTAAAASNGNPYVETVCKVNKMRVRVLRGILGAGGSPSQLTLGTCRASASTKDALYFEYDLGLCGSKPTMINNRVAFSNTLKYDPPTLPGPIRRAAPFTLTVACYYNRYQYSYKIGYTPKIQMNKIFMPMKNRAQFSLTPRNAQWERLSPSDHFVIGKPMFFEAEAPSVSQEGRLYVHSCHATLKKSHTSMPQFPVVENFGCMAESKDSRSRFIPYKKNVVRFTVDAFLFKGMTGQQLYMHCTMSVGTSVPTHTAKSCNYDTKAGSWFELYGSASVCACCDSKCSSAASAVTKVVSSRPWTIEYKVKPTTTPKRKTATTTAAAATTTKKTTTKMTETKTTSQPEEKGTAPVEKTVKELDWPFGGGGVKWVEPEGDERRVKGFAVVEEEVVTEPRRIFEDIFHFDK